MAPGDFVLLLALLAAWAAPAQDAPTLQDAVQQAATDTVPDVQEQVSTSLDLPFFTQIENEPKVGLSAEVREVRTYSDWRSTFKMRRAQSYQNTLNWSWADSRQQEKTSQKRGTQMLYNSGILLPIDLNLTGTWDWSRDETLNNAGLANVASRDFKLMELKLSKSKYDLGRLSNDFETVVGMKDQTAATQGLPNDFSEASIGGRVVSKTKVARGMTVAARVFGQKVGGDRSLGDLTSPSASTTDSLGVRVGFKRRFARGFVEVARGRVEDEYLDFRRNNLGVVDTTGRDEADKIVEEMKTQNATALKFENFSRLGSFSLKTNAAHLSSDLAYKANGLGRTERVDDTFTTTLARTAGADSISVTYDYGWAWDDQRTRASTTNRGRQYNKNRALDFYWKRILFEATEAVLKVQNSLQQSIAENQFNQNDRDRLRQETTFELSRVWNSGFRADMLYAYQYSEDISIRSTRSSNNTIKDSYEIAPGYLWPVADWVRLQQNFRLYIQYTDYVYSEMESVNKNDDYNKRGVLGTKVTLDPWERLTLVIKHDYNKRFNATRVRTDATGNSYYSTDDKQTTSKIDLAATFAVAEGITLEGATYDRLDEKETMATGAMTQNRAGQVWVGMKFVRKYFAATNPLDISCMVKKYSAYGPAVTETTADYWEADVWVKWKF